MQAAAWRELAGVRHCELTGGRWLRSVQVAGVAGDFALQTPADEETALVILGGTFDLTAGPGAWAQRGIRESPFSGRPCALYLPPATPVRARGTGELLLVGCRRPAPAPEAPPPAMRPLLPLAGSGKAYDARTGTWELIERFPSSPEAVLPRAIQRLEVGAVVVERVLPVSFKALALCLDEAVLAGGQELVPPPPTPTGWPEAEVALFVRAPRGASVQLASGRRRLQGDEVVFAQSGSLGPIRAEGGPVYVACAWAAKGQGMTGG